MRRSNRHGGFTLIELLVTMVIIVIAVSFAVPKLSLLRAENVTEKDVRKLSSLIALARDEAALQGRNFGVFFYPSGYQFYDLDPDSELWVKIQGDDMLGAVALADGNLPRLLIEAREITLEPPLKEDAMREREELDQYGQPIPKPSDQPQVYILASGEVTPFVYQLENLYDDEFIALSADYTGQMALASERE